MNSNAVKIRTWFGMDATIIELGPDFKHKPGLGRFVIPHLPGINWVLRWRLQRKDYGTLDLACESADAERC